MTLIRSAIVLAAGLGTRLRPLTCVRAKAAIPLGGEPLICRLASWLGAQGVANIIVNLHHRPETIARALGDGHDLGVSVRYSWEGSTLLGSAGGPRRALPLLDDDPFFILNGDTLTDVDVSALASAHAAGGALVTLALVPNLDPLRYGGVRLDSAGRVSGFVARGPSAQGSLHFTGVQIATAEAFSMVPEGAVAASVGEVYNRLIETRPGSVRGWVTRAEFRDIGTVDDYWRTSQAFAANAAIVAQGRGAHIDPTARLRRTLLWDDVIIEAGCELEECIVTDGVHLQAGKSYRRSIVRRQGDGVVITPFEQVGIRTAAATDVDRS